MLEIFWGWGMLLGIGFGEWSVGFFRKVNGCILVVWGRVSAGLDEGLGRGWVGMC